MDIFKDIVKALDDEYTTFAIDGLSSGEFSKTYDTGSYILNAAISGSIYGGMPDTKRLCLAGETTTGKTFFALALVKAFLDDNPTGAVFYFDTESAVTKEMMVKRGVDASRVIVSEQETVQKFRHRVLQILENYMKVPLKERPPMMLVLDSLGQLSTTKEMTDSIDGSETKDMTRAQLIRATFRTISLKLSKAHVPLVITNHVYANIGGYGPPMDMAGGGGAKFAADQICYLTKSKDTVDKEIIGNFIKIKMHKSRFTREGKVVTVKLNYETGLDRYYGLLELAEKYGLVKKVSTRYEMPDGSKHYEKAIYADPTRFFTKELLDQIDEAAHKEFLYGEGDGVGDEPDLDDVISDDDAELLVEGSNE